MKKWIIVFFAPFYLCSMYFDGLDADDDDSKPSEYVDVKSANVKVIETNNFCKSFRDGEIGSLNCSGKCSIENIHCLGHVTTSSSLHAKTSTFSKELNVHGGTVVLDNCSVKRLIVLKVYKGPVIRLINGTQIHGKIILCSNNVTIEYDNTVDFENLSVNPGYAVNLKNI